MEGGGTGIFWGQSGLQNTIYRPKKKVVKKLKKVLTFDAVSASICKRSRERLEKYHLKKSLKKMKKHLDKENKLWYHVKVRLSERMYLVN